MKLTPVTSSNLKAIGYDAATKKLQVEFHNDTLYEYSGVPSSIADGLFEASSHGQYFDRYIKKGPYNFVRLR